MANTNAPYGFKPYKSRFGGAFEMDYVVLGGTVSAGDPLKRSSGVAVLNDGGALVIGVAAQAGVSGETIGYFPADGTVFRAQTTADTTYASASHDGGVYDVTGTTGVSSVKISDTTGEVFRIIRMAPTGTEEGVYAEVLGVFIQSERLKLAHES